MQVPSQHEPKPPSLSEQNMPGRHAIGWQEPDSHASLKPQRRPHAPQFVESRCTSVQNPEQRVPGRPVESVHVVEPPAVPPPEVPPARPPPMTEPPPLPPAVTKPPAAPPPCPPALAIPPALAMPPALAVPPPRFSTVHTPDAQTSAPWQTAQAAPFSPHWVICEGRHSPAALQHPKQVPGPHGAAGHAVSHSAHVATTSVRSRIGAHGVREGALHSAALHEVR